MDINAKKLKSILTLFDYENIEKALGLRIFSKSDKQVIFYNADKYKDIMSYSKYKRCVRTIKNALIMNKSHYRLESSKYSRQHRLEKIKFR